MYLFIYIPFLFIIYVRPVAMTTKKNCFNKAMFPYTLNTAGSQDKEIHSPTPKIQNSTT